MLLSNAIPFSAIVFRTWLLQKRVLLVKVGGYVPFRIR